MVHGVMGLRRFPGAMLLVAAMLCSGRIAAQTPADPAAPAPQVRQASPSFRGGIDLVTIRAVVRDSKGPARDRADAQGFPHWSTTASCAGPTPSSTTTGPIGLALMFDISGSMDIDERFARARETGYFLLSGLRTGEDEAAIFAFDSSLHMVQPFTTDLDRLKGPSPTSVPWGMTSIHDAIASASRSMDSRATKRRALVVLTDGFDTAEQARCGRGVAHRVEHRPAGLRAGRGAVDRRPAGPGRRQPRAQRRSG